MAIQGAGSVLGGLTATPVLRHLGPAVMVATALALLGTAGLAMVTTRQRLTPSRLQGRTAAASNLPQRASIAAGAALVAVVDH
ncbi:hypothetical protein ACIBIZ_11825 [Nonomuraea spiralis]|uniref:hypothetical protein n=1 Tax=Nonomuraea spiralis TaxID=46182 RepID=UPI003796B8B4